MEERMSIAVVGDPDSIYCYAALGLDIFPATDCGQASAVLAQLAERRYAVIYITEQLACQLESELDRYRDQSVPAIIPIPGITGNTGCGMSWVSKSVERAVGSDIIFNN